MKARTWMLLGSLIAFTAVAQANEQTPAKPATIKLAGQAKLDLRGLTAAEGSHLACDNNGTQDPPTEPPRPRASKPVKDAPALRKPRRMGCDSYHCVARTVVRAAADASLERDPA